MSNIVDKCPKLSILPKFIGNTWFNAILIISLYSQGVRQILLKNSRTWYKDDKLLMILKYILFNYNNPQKVQDYFKKIDPNKLLLLILKRFKEYNVKNWSADFIIKFLKLLSIKCMDIIYYNNNYYLNLDDQLTFHSSGSYKILKKTRPMEVNSILRKNKQELENVPQILCIYHNKLNNVINETFNKLSVTDFDISNTNSYQGLNINGINTYENEITFNGHKYKLDAVSIANYYGDKKHSIVGITCNNKRYVYNNWDENKKTSPCSLIQYNWDLKKNESFCFNSKTCELDFIRSDNKHKLCFSFTKGDRILFYTLIRKKSKSSSPLISSLKSNKTPDFNDLYNIGDFDKETLITLLNEVFNKSLNSEDYTLEDLRKMYVDELNKLEKKEMKSMEEMESIKNKKSSLKIKNIKYAKVMSKKELLRFIQNIYPYVNELKNKKKSDLIKIIKAITNPKKDENNLNKYELILRVKQKFPKLKNISKFNKGQLLALLS